MSGAIQPLMTYASGAAPFVPLSGTYDIGIGNNSTGPELGPGDGSGYYTDALNGVATAGTITPDPMFVTGDPGSAQVVVTASQNDAGNGIIFAVVGTFVQTDITQIAFGAPVNLTLMANVATFDNTTYPGFTLWKWIGSYLNAFEGSNCTVVVS